MNDTSRLAQAITFCTELPAFKKLDDSECQQLLDVATERAFAPGETIIEEGGRSEQLWIVLEGKCEVVRQSEHDGPLVLATLEPHNIFGEMSFFSPAPHSASVVAKTQVRLLSIARSDYDRLLKAGNLAAFKLAYNVTASLAKRLRRMDEWVAELAAGKMHSNGHATSSEGEWSAFRKKVFESWNL